MAAFGYPMNVPVHADGVNNPIEKKELSVEIAEVPSFAVTTTDQ